MSHNYVSRTDNDVVLGKGNGINYLPGNIQFRGLVARYKSDYESTTRSSKAFVAEQVIQDLSSLDPPGRFIELGGDGDEEYVVVSHKRALEKTCQALREKNTRYHRVRKKPATRQPEATKKIEPTVRDVLYGRGTGYISHAGNREFRKRVTGVVLSTTEEDVDNRNLAGVLYEHWVEEGGRFLYHEEEKNSWKILSKSKVVDRITQALRDQRRGKVLAMVSSDDDELESRAGSKDDGEDLETAAILVGLAGR